MDIDQFVGLQRQMPLGVLQTISDCGTQDHVVFFSVTGVAGLKTENAGRQMGIYRGVIMLVQSAIQLASKMRGCWPG